MDINEIREARRELETKLMRIITACVDGFRERTGVSAQSVNVCMTEQTRVGVAEPRCIVTEVIVEIKI